MTNLTSPKREPIHVPTEINSKAYYGEILKISVDFRVSNTNFSLTKILKKPKK